MTRGAESEGEARGRTRGRRTGWQRRRWMENRRRMGSDEQRDREKRVRRSGGAKSEVKRRGLVRWRGAKRVKLRRGARGKARRLPCPARVEAHASSDAILGQAAGPFRSAREGAEPTQEISPLSLSHSFIESQSVIVREKNTPLHRQAANLFNPACGHTACQHCPVHPNPSPPQRALQQPWGSSSESSAPAVEGAPVLARPTQLRRRRLGP